MNPYEGRYLGALNIASDIQSHMPRFVDLVRQRNAQKVIELGVRNGMSTIAWLYALHDTGGHLWSVDMVEYGMMAKVPKILEPGETFPHWTFTQGMSLDGHVLARAMPNDVDICFIDTVHDYETTLLELKAYDSFMKPNGVMLLHDLVYDGKETGVVQAIYEYVEWLNKSERTPVATVQLFSDSYGLGVIALDGDLPFKETR